MAKLIRSLGHSLKTAHETIDRLAAGQQVPIELAIPGDRDVLAELAELNVSAQIVEGPRVDVVRSASASP